MDVVKSIKSAVWRVRGEYLKSYLITSSKDYSRDVDKFKDKLQRALASNRVDYALYRDKDSSDYESLCTIFIELCRAYGVKAVIHTHTLLAKKYGAYAIHLTSNQFDEISRAKSMGLKVIVSTHSDDDIELSILRGADYVTYSPIFHTPNKGEPKGVDELKRVVNKFSRVKFFALGGIVSNSHVDALKSSGCYGFASIRYFL